MFSKSRINETAPRADAPRIAESPAGAAQAGTAPNMPPRSSMDQGASPASAPAAPKSKPVPSVLSADLQISGNLRTSGDIVIEAVVDGDIRAHLLTVGESATIRGEIVADDIVINGRVIGRVRGLKVRLTSTARVEGDIIHKTIAIESGAHFEGSVQRQDDPLTGAGSGAARQAAPAAASPAQAGSGAPKPAGGAPAPRPAQASAPAPQASRPSGGDASAARPAAPKSPVDGTKKAAQ